MQRDSRAVSNPYFTRRNRKGGRGKRRRGGAGREIGESEENEGEEVYRVEEEWEEDRK